MFDKEVYVGSIRYKSRRFNDGLTCVLILRGTVTMLCEQQISQLENGDVAIINDGDLYQLQGEENNLAVMLHFSKAYLFNRFERFFIYRFNCISSSATPEQQIFYESLRKYIAELAFLYYKDDSNSELLFQSVLFKLLHLLLTHFTQSTMLETEITSTPLKQALQWIHQNYQQRITLEKVAKNAFISPQHLSKLFKTELGTTFLQYVTQLRVASAKKDLANYKETITKVAMKNGFASDRAMNQAFLKTIQMTASEYRATLGNVEEPLQDDIDFFYEDKYESLEALVKFINDFDHTSKEVPTAIQKIAVDKIQSQPLKAVSNIVDIGHIKNALRSDVKSQLIEAKTYIKIQYIAFDGILQLVEGAQHDKFYFKLYDFFNCLNFFQKLNMTPFVKIQLNHSYSNFLQTFSHLLKLLKMHFSKAELSNWHFEVIGTELLLNEYFPLILKEFQKHRIQGHIGVRLDANNLNETAKVVKFIAQWHIDFFSYKANPNSGNYSIDSKEYGEFQKVYHVNCISRIKVILQQNGLETVPVYLTDWNTLTGNTTVEAGEFHRTALIIDTLCQLTPDVAGFSFPLALNLEQSNEDHILTHPLSLYIFRNIRRPMFFVCRAYSALKKTIIAQGDGYLFTKDEHDNLVLLLYNAYYNHPFSALHMIRQKDNKKLYSYKITGLTPNKYRVKRLLLDKQSGSIYNIWLNTNLSIPLDEEDFDDYVEHASNPSVKLYEENSNGSITICEQLSMNATALYIFKRYE